MINILFVCMGNICRSPSAEAVMNKVISQNGYQKFIQCDSAGTIGYHSGEAADARMKKHAMKRNIFLTSIARQIKSSDLVKFDYILAMDKDNFDDILSLDNSSLYSDKISMMTDYCTSYNADKVPDPYYGGPEGFEYVLDLLEDASAGLLNKILTEHPEINEID